MSAAATTSSDRNLALMREMGAESYDPLPPEQYLCFLDKDLRITPSAQEALAWMRKWTVRGRVGGRSAHASDGPKRPLRLKDMAEELKWSAPFTSRIWAELEDAGLVRKDDRDRLFLCGRVKPRRRMKAADADEDDYGEMSEYEKFCSERLPHYVWRQFKEKLDPETRRRASVEYYEADKYIRRVRADAVGQVRDWEENYLESIFSKYGITLRRHEDKPEDPAKAKAEPEAPRRFQVALEVKPAELSVQNFSPDPVQATSDTKYSTSAETVPGSYPYEISEIDRVDRVSKCADPGPEPGFSCEDLPTPQGEAPTQTPEPEPTPYEPIPPQELPTKPERKPKAPVERKTTRELTTRGLVPEVLPGKLSGPIVAYVEKLFGRGQSPVILMKFETLAAEFHLTPEAVTRFLLEKWQDKLRNGYPVKSAGALLQFAREDLPGWIAQNRRELSHSARQEAPAILPAVIPPAEELRELEMWLCEHPKGPDQDYTRARIAELREQLGDAAPPPYKPPTKAEELATLEAELRRFKDERGMSGALDPWVKITAAKIKKLKQELGADAAGAAG